jgi:hypothetical protein
MGFLLRRHQKKIRKVLILKFINKLKEAQNRIL